MLRALTLIMTGVLLSIAWMPSGVAQEEPLPGLYLTSERAPVPATNVCQTITYGATDAAPAEGAAESKAHMARSYIGSGCTTIFAFTAPRAMQMTGDTVVNVWVACDSASVNAGVSGATSSLRFQVYVDGTKEGADANWAGANACTSTVTPITVTIATGDVEIDEGVVIQLRIINFYLTGGPGDAPNLHVRVGSPERASGLFNAGFAVQEDDSVTQEILPEGASARVDLTFVNATNATLMYAWMSSLNGTAQITYNATLTAGNASILIVDAANDTLLEAAVEGNASQTVTADSQPGNWTITIVVSDAVGDLSLDVQAYVPPVVADASGNETQDDAGTTLNETAPAEGGGIPGLHGPAAVLGFALAALVASRRPRRD